MPMRIRVGMGRAATPVSIVARIFGSMTVTMSVAESIPRTSRKSG